ncbi:MULTISPECIES: glycosyltransferase family 2 protein [Prochlorococcus]|uniref:Glycosyltransferase n=1 Tax=Prochlorococcus marinus (strain SARG / CCMP1375 / SS120) TaxID=167539 RepID=Q7VAX8_PROMA|nr:MULTISPECIES: glycosyltransferase family A protein [Prochlorococcus]AAQ00369.1 Glycosyltransferase [Prochlorococcus marinus subsp. marinus str. CCMP1375]
MTKPIYSICICNYNMADTLAVSLASILNQIDNKYEVVVVDDGSKDSSLEILLDLSKKDERLRVIPLIRDSRRKLGETRNVSIRAARGKYVVLHIDADDIWEPYIDSYIRIYHEIEKRLDIEDFMLSGRQIQMVTKKLMIENPYHNIYYGEDRLLWSRLAVLGKLVSLEHKVFRERIALKSVNKKLKKMITSQCSALNVSFTYSPAPLITLKQYVYRIFSNSDWGFKLSFINLIFLIPCFINGTFLQSRRFTNLSIWDYRKLTMIDLLELEEKTKLQFGVLNLNNDERNIYIRRK